MKRAPTYALALVFIALAGAQAADYGTRLGLVREEGPEYPPTGAGVLDVSLHPRLGETYLPQELYSEYGWRQWEYTNQAYERYLRYVGANLEGDRFYDVFGNHLTKGWLVYDARKEQPRASEGNSLYKSGFYGGTFSNLAISTDRKGQYHYSMTIGDEIATTLTPLTFRKAAFNGTQFDFRSENLGATLLLSRVNAPLVQSLPLPAALTNTTDLTAGRVTASVGPATFGATLVNGHQSRASLERFDGNPLKGHLTTAQASSTVGEITIRLSDDSPDDREGGVILYSERVIVEDLRGNKYDSAEIGFRANRDGGLVVDGFPTASGAEHILLNYDLRRFADVLPTTVDSLKEVRFELQVGDDYLIEIASEVQTNVKSQPVFLPVARATGNIKDASNRRVISFNYGLPTANQVAGLSMEISELAGFSLYAEYVVNTRYRQLPNALLRTHSSSADRSTAWMVNAARNRRPWFLYGEAFSMDEAYNTSFYLTDPTGQVDYGDPERYLFDFVDDNDDQDRWPDQKRAFQGTRQVVAGRTLGSPREGQPDQAVFPGWDENGDFISDFNQNDNPVRPNAIPDFEEPFLRFNADRPEFLFGIDMNNNGWIDRFEDDAAPDYPYKLDRRGYNLYGGYTFSSEARALLGNSRQKTFTSNRRSSVSYAMFTVDKRFPRAGRVRFYERIKKVRDDIPDPRIDLPAFLGAPQVMVPDPLQATDAWVNTAWLGYDVKPLPDLHVGNKLKHEIYRQEGDGAGSRDNPRFFGLVNKAEYVFSVGKVTVRPRLKYEVFHQVPYSRLREKRHWMREMGTLLLRFPVLWGSFVEAGIEQVFHSDLETEEEKLETGDRTGDLRQTVLALQLSTRSSYLGYRSITHVGLRWDRNSFERREAANQIATGSILFVSVFAGLRD